MWYVADGNLNSDCCDCRWLDCDTLPPIQSIQLPANHSVSDSAIITILTDVCGGVFIHDI